MAIRTAYARWAGSYDNWFGPMLRPARVAGVSAANMAPGEKVLEVGVGTGLALPLYSPTKRITGVDLSAEMLLKARCRIAALHLLNVEQLLEMDAEATSFQNGQFDIAVAMFVASVAPDPRALVAELRRIVKPGGTLLFVNHFSRERGVLSRFERALAPASAMLGWHSDFRLDQLFSPSDLASVTLAPLPPFGFFQLAKFGN